MSGINVTQYNSFLCNMYKMDFWKGIQVKIDSLDNVASLLLFAIFLLFHPELKWPCELRVSLVCPVFYLHVLLDHAWAFSLSFLYYPSFKAGSHNPVCKLNEYTKRDMIIMMMTAVKKELMMQVTQANVNSVFFKTKILIRAQWYYCSLKSPKVLPDSQLLQPI